MKRYIALLLAGYHRASISSMNHWYTDRSSSSALPLASWSKGIDGRLAIQSSGRSMPSIALSLERRSRRRSSESNGGLFAWYWK